MTVKEKQAWRTIVSVLQETGYDKLYDEEVHIIAECLRRCEQQERAINDAMTIYENCRKTQDFSTCDLDIFMALYDCYNKYQKGE